MPYIIGQSLGVVAIALGFLSFQMKTQKNILIVQIVTAVVFALHYLLIGAVIGMAMNTILIFRNIAYYFRSKKGSNNKIVPICFIVIITIVGIITWDEWHSIFMFMGVFLNTIAMSFANPQNVRRSILVTCPLAIIYDLFERSYGGIVYETVAIISAIIGLVRYRQKKQAACKKEAEK